MSKIKINHVLSNNTQSNIFDHILNYFSLYAGSNFCYSTSIKPIDGMDIYHYHRPQLEEKLLERSVVTVHHDLCDIGLEFDKFKQNYKQASLIICLNHSQKKFLREYSIDNTVIIPHGYNSSYLRLCDREYDGSRRIVIAIISVRYTRKVKGEAYIYELAKRLDPNKFEFLLVGKDRKIDAKFLRKFGFFVRCYEYLPYPVLCDAYKYIDLLLVASLFEGGPANIPEAVAMGVPIISSPVGMALDIIKPGKNGYFLSFDIKKDAYLLKKLAEDDNLNILFRESSKNTELVVPWSEVVTRYESEYCRLLDK